MRRLSIERLSLHVPGLSRDEGAALGRKLTERLAAAQVGPEAQGSIGRLNLRLEGRPSEGIDALAERMAAEILRGLERR